MISKEQVNFSNISTHRITLNVLFWVGYFVYPFLRFRYTGEHTVTIEEIAFYLFFYGSILYFNNLFLLPKYLESRRYKQYAFIIIPILVAAAFFESFVNKTLLKTCSCEGPNSIYAIYNFIHLGSIMVIFAAVHILRTLNQKVRAFEKSENARLETELKFLKSQVNPHMLFNSLNSIYGYALEHSERVPEMVIKLSEILRYMLYECDKPLVPLERELSYLKDYVALQQMRLEDVTVDFQVLGETSSLEVAPMIFIAYVENAFKYAGQIERNADVKIYFKISRDQIYFRIQNTFEKFKEEKTDAELNGGLGMKNAQSLLNISYPGKHKLDQFEEDGMFVLKLEIQVN